MIMNIIMTLNAKAQSMAQLNWRPGMWPASGRPEAAGWDYSGSLLGRIGVVEGPMKRTASNQSMSSMSMADSSSMMNMWHPQMIHPGAMMPHPSAMGMHPSMYPGFHPMMPQQQQQQQQFSGSHSCLVGGGSSPSPMMMNQSSHGGAYDPRSSSPASSQRSRRSYKSSSQKRSTKVPQWSDSEDERYSGESDASEQPQRKMSSSTTGSHNSRRQEAERTSSKSRTSSSTPARAPTKTPAKAPAKAPAKVSTKEPGDYHLKININILIFLSFRRMNLICLNLVVETFDSPVINTETKPNNEMPILRMGQRKHRAENGSAVTALSSILWERVSALFAAERPTSPQKKTATRSTRAGKRTTVTAAPSSNPI